MRTADFYRYLVKREETRLRKEAGLSFPWTKDKIICRYKFCNVFRKHDQTSKWFIDKYAPFSDTPANILLNCGIFRYFGTTEFFRRLEWSEKFDPKRIRRVAHSLVADDLPVFTGAYIITNASRPGPKLEVVIDFLGDLDQHKKRIVEVAEDTASWEQAHAQLSLVDGFGGSGFMAMQVMLDTFYFGRQFWGNSPVDYWSWTPVGPGARRGAARLLGREVVRSAERRTRGKASVAETREVISILRNKLGSYWPKLWPPLAAHDIQFGLCEFDKYERVRLGEGRPRSIYRPT